MSLYSVTLTQMFNYPEIVPRMCVMIAVQGIMIIGHQGRGGGWGVGEGYRLPG